uniref:IRG-type G domain-containing protein n=1 Tax=Acrobeloides nanus TaxID=290746 RepID=A0A914EPW5_9BILA
MGVAFMEIIELPVHKMPVKQEEQIKIIHNVVKLSSTPNVVNNLLKLDYAISGEIDVNEGLTFYILKDNTFVRSIDNFVQHEKDNEELAARRKRQNNEIKSIKRQIREEKVEAYSAEKKLKKLSEAFEAHKKTFVEYVNAKPARGVNIKLNVKMAKEKLGIDTNNYFNFAFVGHAKTGKSSLINAIRGMTDDQIGSAKVGITETTHEIQYYVFPNNRYKHVRIYDIPGAGTLTHGASNYYEDKSLCAFDCLIICTQDTLGQEEIEFAMKALRYRQAITFVRSRCDIALDTLKKLRKIRRIDQDAVNACIKEMATAYAAEVKRTGREELESVPCFFVNSYNLRNHINNEENDVVYHEELLVEYMRMQSMYTRNIVSFE